MTDGFAEIPADETLAYALHEVAILLNRSLDLDTILDSMPELIERVVPFDAASIILVEKDKAVQARYYGKGEFSRDGGGSRDYKIQDIPSLRMMSESFEPLLIPDTVISSLWVKKPHLAWVKSYLGTPILLDGSIIGFLNLNSARSGFYNPANARNLSALADLAAIALQNARLFLQAKSAAMLEERQRLARDLHDSVSQSLWTATIIAEVLPDLWQKNPDLGRQSLDNLRRLTEGALAEMRTLLLELRPAALMDTDLPELLQQLVQTTMSRRKLDITLNVDDKCKRLSDGQSFADITPEVQVNIYRIAQEALNNITKHSRAHTVQMCLQPTGTGIKLLISDDGMGFDKGKLPQESMGLEIMSERAAEIGAQLIIKSNPGQGTEILVEWPDPVSSGAVQEM